jgi:hypothetical protein
MDTEEKISDLIKRGYRQVSRKYRRVAALPEGKTGIQAIRDADPSYYKGVVARIEESCADQYLRVYAKDKLELTREEFAEFLRQTGRGVLPEDGD